MMVIGELVDTQPHPLIKAIKIQDLSDQHLARVIWPSEVQDSEIFLSSQQKQRHPQSTRNTAET